MAQEPPQSEGKPLLNYAGPRPRGRGRFRVDWLLLVVGVLCGMWIWASWALPLGQPVRTQAERETRVMFVLLAGSVCSLPAVVVFLLVWWMRATLRRREKRPGGGTIGRTAP